MNYGKLTAGTTKTAIDTAKLSEKGEIIPYLSRMGDVLDQTIDLTGFLVALVRRISVVNQTDKADAPNGEKPIDILFYQFQFAGKTGLALAKNDVKLMCFGIVQQTLEFRPIPVRTGVIIIAVNVIYFPALLNGIFQQHGLLILDAVAVIRFLFLVAVFFRQSAINRNLFHLLCLRSI